MPSNNAQKELFGVDQYGVHRCPKCHSLGTIVEMKLCCQIAAMVAAESGITHPPPTGELKNGKSTPPD
jgi:hypothetical protein